MRKILAITQTFSVITRFIRTHLVSRTNNHSYLRGITEKHNIPTLFRIYEIHICLPNFSVCVEQGVGREEQVGP